MWEEREIGWGEFREMRLRKGTKKKEGVILWEEKGGV